MRPAFLYILLVAAMLALSAVTCLVAGWGRLGTTLAYMAGVLVGPVAIGYAVLVPRRRPPA